MKSTILNVRRIEDDIEVRFGKGTLDIFQNQYIEKLENFGLLNRELETDKDIRLYNSIINQSYAEARNFYNQNIKSDRRSR